MLDSFEILTTSGVVLWSKQYVPVSSNIINALITDVFIEERIPSAAKTGDDNRAARNTPYRKEKYTLKYTTAKDIGLIFVAVYQSLLSLSWVDDLLDVVRGIFIKEFSSDLKKANRSKLSYSSFDRTFDALVNKLDKTSSETGARPSDTESASEVQLTPPSSSAGTEDGVEEQPPPPVPGFKRTISRQMVPEASSADATPLATPETSRPSSPAVSHLVTGKAGPGAKMSRRAKKALNSSTPASSGDESTASRRSLGPRKASGKAKRRWDADGFAAEGDDDEVLDYSQPGADDGVEDASAAIEDVRADQMGERTGKGQFVLKDLDDEVNAIIAESRAKDEKKEEAGGLLGSSVGAISGYFKSIVGGKTLTKQDLEKPLKNLEDHLLRKNVAREAAVRLCESVERDLVGVKTANFTSIDATLRTALSKALTRILTPTTSLDLLRAINTTISSPTSPRPYVISIVGVNGVGKSTNLSKLAYFLLQNSYRVLICAADTFRSGAVEQLRVHVRNLSELSRRENVGHVELFEKGYGKDAAVIARDAVVYASQPDTNFDVVLIDTAGRRHNDTRLMSSLTKFGQLANPDKIFMVGEALVGSDAVAQARNFSAQFVDAKGRGRGLDGFIISKCDTVGDMVGTLVSMVHATGIPVVFLGVGQHYGDLRGLNVGWAVERLMR
ncbi:P-loop containing nucleoside triphosphate hydrolase protein [Myriangium duriaei CBS 260.36]|uniref:Signal recognition particle receptor subunit alpha homolog n=1 Tax=Myriangium duriaei CBS 260.36 TaxID=1168546 RepID=A0A9P4MMY6_9PEZI|nr:P-loop containing nucleoside triphosphate hydrolase protein [Myriangium duriaei CBS 260.36]